MDFAEALENEAKWTKTENGAVALNTTGDGCLDLFSTIGSLREADDTRIQFLFAEAYKEDPLFATKIAFYGRDIRGGLGERRTFRVIMKYIANHHPEALKKNLDLIGVYGRYDDLYCLIGTPLEDDMWAAMKKQFEEDRKNLADGNAVSLLAKWIKTPDASSSETKRLGILTAKKLGYSVYEFKRMLRALRKQIDVVERHMSANEWDQIKYSKVPSRAMMIYRNAFMKHDEERFNNFINQATIGQAKINSATLYPYDIAEKFLNQWMYWRNQNLNESEKKVLEAQWSQLPNYIEPGTNALVIADTSGSMEGRPLATSVGLAIYFAEHNVGAYHDMFMTFSSQPEIVKLKGETLEQKLRNAMGAHWNMSTNLHAAFQLVLDIAIKNNVMPDEMPKSLIVISDMEIDYCGDHDWSFYDQMSAEFSAQGYQIPNVIFWNVNSRHDVFHADKSRKGVQLCSGQSASTFKQLVGAVGMTPVEFMHSVIDSERYEPIAI